MKLPKLLLTAIVFLIGQSTTVRACDFCMLGQGVNPYLTAKGEGIILDVNTIQSDAVYDGTQTINSNNKKEEWLLYTVTGFYPLMDGLTLLVGIPYATKTNLDYDSGSNSNPGVLTNGLGDMSVTARYTLFTQHSLEATFITGVLGGVKLPTGATNIYDVAGNPVDRHALPGTGSVDYNLGVTSSYSVASGHQFTMDAVYSFSGMGAWAGRSHQYGNGFNASAKYFYRIWPSLPQQKSVFLFTGPLYEWTGEELGTQTNSGYNAKLLNASSGGIVGYWELGVYSVLSEGTVLNVSLAKAVYHDMNLDNSFDTDPAEDYKLDLALTFLL